MNNTPDVKNTTNPPNDPEGPPKPPLRRLSKRTWLIIGGVIVVLIAAVIAIAMRGGKDNAYKRAATASDQPLRTQQTSKNVGALPCTPESGDGHSNYRTQETLAVDPKDPKTLYIGVEYKGVYKSTDGGATWKASATGITAYDKQGGGKCYQEMGRTLIDPSDSKHILLSRVETPGTIHDIFSENAGLWSSMDAGSKWTQLVNGEMNASGSHAIAFGANNKTIYYGVNNNPASYDQADKTKYYNKVGVLYRTTDGGKNWKELNTGLVNSLRATQVFVSGQHVVLFTAVLANGGVGGGAAQSNPRAVMVSHDGGDNWTNLGDKLPTDYQLIIGGDASVGSLDHFFAISQAPLGSNKNKDFYTTDGGKTFKESDSYVYVAKYNPYDTTGNTLLGYAPFANQPGVMQSLDGGATWTSVGGALPKEVDNQGNGVRISNFVWDPVNKNTVYASGNKGLVWKSTDGGKNWATIATLDSYK